MKPTLNEFQESCRRALHLRLDQIRHSLGSEEIVEVKKGMFAQLLAGTTQSMALRAELAHLRLWIYDDGCEIINGNESIAFEAEEFSNGAELQRAFVDEVVRALSRRDTLSL